MLASRLAFHTEKYEQEIRFYVLGTNLPTSGNTSTGDFLLTWLSLKLLCSGTFTRLRMRLHILQTVAAANNGLGTRIRTKLATSPVLPEPIDKRHITRREVAMNG